MSATASHSEKPYDIAPRCAKLDVTNTIAAFTEDQVERVTRLSKARLRYWSRTGFFRPSYVEPRETPSPSARFYSFRDVVALRTIEMLRVGNNVPLQHLRLVAESLARLSSDVWTFTTLYVVDRKVVFASPETGHPQEVVSGQYTLVLPLAAVIEDTGADIAALQQRRSETIGRLSRDKGVNANTLVVAGTRIPVASIRRLSEDGFSPERIIAEFPDLSLQDVQAALQQGHVRAA